MDPELARIAEALLRFGPVIIVLATFLETAFITGLLVPAGVMTALAAFLAAEGHLDVWAVLVAAAAGGSLGDSCGFWLGRRSKARVRAPRSRLVVAILGRKGVRGVTLFQRRPIFAVTLARLVSFVRTLMPMVAGRSELTYPRFLAYQLPGAIGYAVMYVAIGYLAGESWRQVSAAMGTGWAVLFGVIAVALWIAARQRALHRVGGAVRAELDAEQEGEQE